MYTGNVLELLKFHDKIFLCTRKIDKCELCVKLQLV